MGMNPIADHESDERRWAEWMQRAQRGDGICYEHLLTEIARVVERYLRARFGDIDVLEDCVQECLLAVHLARHTYDPRRPFRPWMFTIVRHRTIDVLRQRRTRLRFERSLAREQETVLEREALSRLVLGVRVLERLAPGYQEAVALTKYAGYSTAEAAAWLGVSEPALKARLHRGLLAIRRQLEEETLTA
jgi:RNA polymerase sigma-70 factor (ECF subfamily)